MTATLPETIDLHHLGSPGALGAHWFDGAIVDPGPERTLPRLLEGLGDRVPERILLTHIHFDHAGATGALVERFPDVEVWVHERGARHIVDPTRLVRSARGVFGEAFDMLWGEVVPVPQASLRVLEGGERIGSWRVAYTPGHAQHHVSYLHEDTGVAYTGDVTGIRIDGGPALPPTPPPDIDPPLWHASLDLIAAWDPAALAFMHFGVVTDDVPEQIAGVHGALDRLAAVARRTDAVGMAAELRAWITAEAPDAVDTYYAAGPFEGLWGGLDRYWGQVAARARPDDAA
ncbi:MAG: MBL fold metallo-hydrolase [Solirubrobacteraceae bacterium]|nr:MBL fold metallo-hydrolase [Solirubrobacteraceae bacterium]